MQLPVINRQTPMNEVAEAMRHPALAARGQAMYEAVMRLRTKDAAAASRALSVFVQDRDNWDARLFQHLPFAAIALAEWLRVDAAGAGAAFVSLPLDLRSASQEYLSDLGAWTLLRDLPAQAA